jgi:predicted MPP superfamily phosphohydrolase
MALLILLTVILAIIALFCSIMFYEFGYLLLGDWSSRVGLGAVTFFIFAMIGISAKKVLKEISRVILKKISFFTKYSKITTGTRLDDGRRRFLHYFINIGIIATSGSLSVNIVAESFRFPHVKKVEIEIENLHPDLEGLSIVQLSDLHITKAIRRNWVQKIVTQVNNLTPDIIAFTGDIVDANFVDISHIVGPFADLTARYGKYFVTGNHEYLGHIHSLDEWIQEIENLGFTVLLNNHRLIHRGRSLMLIGGVTDYGTNTSDPAQALGNGSNADLKILLAHQPQSVYEASQAGYDIQLSGHTHGGHFPLARWLASLGQPFQSGLYKYKNTHIYVSNGAGYGEMRLRHKTPSEISYLKLTAKASTS